MTYAQITALVEDLKALAQKHKTPIIWTARQPPRPPGSYRTPPSRTQPDLIFFDYGSLLRRVPTRG